MKKLVVWLSLLASLVQFVGSAQQRGFVTTVGKEILDPGGHPLVLRGINLGNWLVPEGYMFKFDSATSPRLINEVLTELVGPEEASEFWHTYRENYIRREDIRYIRSIGLNSVRIPFHWGLFESENPEGIPLQTGFELLDRAIRWCAEESLFVVLDMHCAPGGQTGDNIDDSWGYPFLFDSPAEQERMVRIWKSISARYRNEPAVAGYDLLNEPIPPFFDTTRLNPLLEPLYKRAVAAIREVDTNHLLFLGGGQWDNNFRVFGPPFDTKLVYTYHKYWCDTTQGVIQEYLDFRDRYNVPVWMGESGENTGEWIASFRRLQERNGIGWCFWPYKKMGSSRCVVSIEIPRKWEFVKKYADSPRSSYAAIRAHRPPRENIREALREFLDLSLFEKCVPNRHYIEALGCSLVK